MVSNPYGVRAVPKSLALPSRVSLGFSYVLLLVPHARRPPRFRLPSDAFHLEMDSIDSATASVEVQCMFLCVHQPNGGWDHSHNMDEWVVERKLPNASKANSKHQTHMHAQCIGNIESAACLEESKGCSVQGGNLLHLHRQTSILMLPSLRPKS